MPDNHLKQPGGSASQLRDDVDVDIPPLLFPLPSSPLRPTNWRWQLAENIAIPRRGRKPRWLKEYLDQYVLMAVDHLRGVIRTTSKSLPRETFDQARQLYDGPEPRRCRLEARLLAGLSVEEVAAAEQLPAPVIQAFGALFFDIANCLDGVDYILSRAIVNQPGSLIPCGQGQTVKRLAYHCGPFILSALLLEVGWNTPWDLVVVGPDAGLGPYVRLLLATEELPPIEFLLVAKLLGDDYLFSGAIPSVPAWIRHGMRRLAAEKRKDGSKNSGQPGSSDVFEPLPEIDRCRVA